MTQTHADTAGRPATRRPAPALVVLIAVALAGLLLVQGLVAGGSVLGPVSLLVLLLLTALTLVVTAASAGTPRAWRYHVLPPAAAGLATVTLVVGTAYFPGSTAWWVPAALLSAGPVLLAVRLQSQDGPQQGA